MDFKNINKKKILNWLNNIGIIIFTIMTIYFGYNYYQDYKSKQSDASLTNIAQNIANESKTENNTDTKKSDVPPIDITKLSKEMNKNIMGWIKVPNTNIDEPIVQTTDNEFYLNHDLNDNYNIYGSIFLDTDSKKDMSNPMSYLFGHNADTGTKFTQLKKYDDPEFAKNNKYFYVYTVDKIFKYEVLDNGAYINPVTPLYPEKQFVPSQMNFIKQELKKIGIDGVDNLTDKDKLMMLVTCKNYDDSTQRKVLFGKLIDTFENK